jgi:hypothetical protein
VILEARLTDHYVQRPGCQVHITNSDGRQFPGPQCRVDGDGQHRAVARVLRDLKQGQHLRWAES